MKAIVRTKYGPPDVLELKEVAKPTLKDNEVLVKVHATTVNRTDCGILRAKPFLLRLFHGLLRPKKRITGTDFAGTVEAIGADVASFAVGEKVFGFDDMGLRSHAQYLVIPEEKGIVTMPKNVTCEQAAASLEGAHYAYNFIRKANISKGHRVLVNGATGAIGSAAVQILVYLGASVAAVGNTKNMKLVKSLGAKRVINYEKEDFTKDEQNYDVVFDAVGKSTFGKCKPLLYPGGVYISTELGPAAQNVYLPLITKLFGSKKVKFPIPTDVRGSIYFIKKRITEGTFQPVIDRKYPLEQIRDAYRYVETGQKTGNVVINI